MILTTAEPKYQSSGTAFLNNHTLSSYHGLLGLSCALWEQQQHRMTYVILVSVAERTTGVICEARQ